MAELAEWDRFVAANDWRGGAALHVDTGMHRLGLTPRGSRRHGAAAANREPRHQAAHEPSCLRRHAGPSAERPADPAVSRDADHVSRRAVLARQFVRHFSRRHRPLRSGAAWHRALRRQTRSPGQQQPDGPVVELRGRIVAGARRSSKGDTVGYGATWTAARAEPDRGHRGRLRATAILRAAGAAKGKPPAQRRSSPASAARSIGRISMDLLAVDVTDLPAGAARRGEFATLIGEDRGHRSARGRVRHDQLRNADQSRPALSPHLSRLIVCPEPVA